MLACSECESSSIGLVMSEGHDNCLSSLSANVDYLQRMEMLSGQ